MIDAVAIFNQSQNRNQIYYSRMNENTKLAMIIVTMTRMTVAVKAMLRCLVANCYCLIFLAIAAFKKRYVHLFSAPSRQNRYRT